MSRDPAVTFRGALQILGHHEDPTWLTRLNRLLGGVILASGAAPPVSALFGLVDQKTEAVSLLGAARAKFAERFTDTAGLDRHQLAVAAHTTIAIDALFRPIHAAHPDADLTQAEKLGMVTAQWSTTGDPLVRALYAMPVPAPNLTRGFHDNVAAIRDWAASVLPRIQDFLSGLDLSRNHLSDSETLALVDAAYQSNFLALATTVKEFEVWSTLAEHAATRSSMSRLETLLTTLPLHTRDLRTTIRSLNRAELDRPIIEVNTDGYGTGAIFPSVDDTFITPHFRAIHTDPSSRLADETWWQTIEPSPDLDLALARHFLTTESTKHPLLLLGHPGAGKSLLTKVLAARLPDTYTVVRIPLRKVDASTNVVGQITSGLHTISHGTVEWSALADQSSHTVRVVILDGLDELLQATTLDRTGYLTDIAEFQRVEAALGRPVAVVVTSRVLVADRIRVPDHTPVIKLDEFDDTQITAWTTTWNAHNPGNPLPVAVALKHRQLAAQPLLLLMLSLYFTDPDTVIEDDLSQTDLYTQILTTYARREVTKQADHVPRDRDLTKAVDDQITRLSIAALGMFNRGNQSITESDLTGDLRALGETIPDGGRVLGEFFFVHSSEALADTVHRSYEFLHLTFGEYLVARHIVEVLRDTVASTHGRRGPVNPDDNLLCALLSHQVLSVQRPMLTFIEALLGGLGSGERHDIALVLTDLISARRTLGTGVPDYRPLPLDHIRAIAAYSANQVLLRCAIDAVETSEIWPGSDAISEWNRLADLWSAGLSRPGYNSLVSSLQFRKSTIALFHGYPRFARFSELRFRNKDVLADRLEFASTIFDESVAPPSRREQTLAAAVAFLVGRQNLYAFTHDLQPEADLVEFVCQVFVIARWRHNDDTADFFGRWLLTMPPPRSPELIQAVLASLDREAFSHRFVHHSWLALLDDEVEVIDPTITAYLRLHAPTLPDL